MGNFRKASRFQFLGPKVVQILKICESPAGHPKSKVARKLPLCKYKIVTQIARNAAIISFGVYEVMCIRKFFFYNILN